MGRAPICLAAGRLDAIIALGTLSAEPAARGLEGSHFRVRREVVRRHGPHPGDLICEMVGKVSNSEIVGDRAPTIGRRASSIAFNHRVNDSAYLEFA